MQMGTWNVSGTSLSRHEEPIIRDIVDDITEDGDNYDFDLDDEDQFNRSSQYIPSGSQSGHNIDCDLNEHMSFMSKVMAFHVFFLNQSSKNGCGSNA